MNRIQSAYKDLFTILSSTNPFLVPLAFALAILSGVLPPVFVLASERLMTDGLSIARGELAFSAIVPTMLIFIVSAVLPDLLNLLQQVYVEPQTELIFRSAYKGRMLQKLKKLRYEHYENKESREIIDKAYGRAETAALHLFPKYFCNALTATVATAGTLILFLKIRWWFLFTLLAPVVLERVLCFKNSFNIYEEMETYWEKEIQYEKLEKMLCEPKTIRENRLNQSSDFLIRTFQKRLGARNREYERYYFQNLRHHFAERNISRVGQLINAGLLLWIYQTGELSFPTFVALAGAIFTTLAENLSYYTNIVANMGYHIKAYEYYDRFFNLSEETYGEAKEVPKDCSIAFEDVCFTYPGTDRQVLSHMSFEIRAGEKISIVGMNGEGKTTMVKLLLGLFEPDSGRILIGGKPLQAYARDAREKIFGTVFQDFTRYSISLRENVGIGDVEQLSDREAVREAMQKGNVLPFLERLPEGEDTMLNRDFEGGVDLSGGQWQRIALARALMGDRPVLILDEPTSQLDPMAESELYSEFAKLAENKTSLFITHRLGSTRITDRILVISKGRVVDTGTHEELLERGGIYADMWKAQKQWYQKKWAQKREVNSHE